MKTATRTDIHSTLKDFETNAFTIEVNAQSFHVLLDSLYTNKVRAVIRELWTNAFDAHVEAGVPDCPFECQLPTTLEPLFRVRDFGVSMDHQSVMKLYSTVFASTKRNTNDQVGCLGLGSKSPFAYTDAFQVTAWLDGEKRTYLCALDEEGVPSITAVGAEPSDEPRGIEVRFPVQTQHISEFKREAEHVARGFDVTPIGSPLEIPNPILVGDGWRVYEEAEHGIRQGCVIYPVTSEQLYIDMHFRNGQGVVIDVPIGTVDIAASREALSLDDKTKDIVTNLFDAASESIQAQVKDAITSAPNLLAAERAYVQASSLIYLQGDCTYGPEGHGVKLTGSIRLYPGASDTPYFYNYKGKLEHHVLFPVKDLHNIRLIVKRTATKVPRRAVRVKKWAELQNTEVRHHTYVLVDPTPAQLRFLVKRLGLITTIPADKAAGTRSQTLCLQVISDATLPDYPPAPREKVVTSDGAWVTPKYSGLYVYGNHGAFLDSIDALPADYLWVPITSPLHNGIELGPFSSRWNRIDTFHTVRDLSQKLGITAPVVYLTAGAQAKAKVDQSKKFVDAVHQAIAAQTDEFLENIKWAKARNEVSQNKTGYHYSADLLFEGLHDDISSAHEPDNQILNQLDHTAVREARDAGVEIAEEIQTRYPLLFSRRITDEAVREYIETQGAK